MEFEDLLSTAGRVAHTAAGTGTDGRSTRAATFSARELEIDADVAVFGAEGTFYRSHPTHIGHGVMGAAADLAVGIAGSGVCMMEAGSALKDGEIQGGLCLIGGAIVYQIVGTVSASGQLVVGTVNTIPLIPTMLRPVRRHLRDLVVLQDVTVYTGRPRDIVGKTIHVKGCLALVESYHAKGWLNGSFNGSFRAPGEHIVTYITGANRGQSECLVLKRAQRGVRILGLSHKLVPGGEEWHVVSAEEQEEEASRGATEVSRLWTNTRVTSTEARNQSAD
mmetsp:Transcript_76621/g.219860  ORF Transcript_76621/g.219860 Transcript_76621/m.219860 type:complete len:278 (+) Transcript_76621:319-1152(+)